MLTNIMKNLASWFTELGDWGTFLSSFGLFPPEIILAISGALNSNAIMKTSLIAAAGATIGGAIPYTIGYYFHDKDILAFLKGKGRFLKISEDSYNQGYNYITKHGKTYLFISRFIPWFRVVSIVAAGFVRYKLFQTTIIIFIGTFMYSYIFAYIGTKIGVNWEFLKYLIEICKNILIALVLIITGIYLYRRKSHRK